MKMTIYTIFDAAAQTFTRPIFLPADGMATRVFVDMIQDPNQELHKYPQDYTLFRIGTYDDQDANIEPQPAQRLMSGSEAIKIARQRRLDEMVQQEELAALRAKQAELPLDEGDKPSPRDNCDTDAAPSMGKFCPDFQLLDNMRKDRG